MANSCSALNNFSVACTTRNGRTAGSVIGAPAGGVSAFAVTAIPARQRYKLRLERMIWRTIRSMSLAVLLCLAGCFGFLRDKVLDEPYRLVAIDLPEDMMLVAL